MCFPNPSSIILLLRIECSDSEIPRIRVFEPEYFDRTPPPGSLVIRLVPAVGNMFPCISSMKLNGCAIISVSIATYSSRRISAGKTIFAAVTQRMGGFHLLRGLARYSVAPISGHSVITVVSVSGFPTQAGFVWPHWLRMNGDYVYFRTDTVLRFRTAMSSFTAFPTPMPVSRTPESRASPSSLSRGKIWLHGPNAIDGQFNGRIDIHALAQKPPVHNNSGNRLGYYEKHKRAAMAAAAVRKTAGSLFRLWRTISPFSNLLFAGSETKSPPFSL